MSKSKEKNKILGYFLTNPDSRHYINEMADMFNMYPANANKQLKSLEKEGVLKSEFAGKQRYFFLDKQFPLLKQYKEIFQKTYGVEQRLKEIFEIKKEIKEAYIFGSYAKDTMDFESDIDVLVVGGIKTLKLEKIALELQKEFGRELNIVSISNAEFMDKKSDSNPFIKKVFSDKIIRVK